MASAATVDDAGTNQFQTLHMANIKEQHHAGRKNASGVSLQLKIDKHHDQWCVDNGYPVNSFKRQASSAKVLERQANIIKFFRDSSKLQAVSFKLQAASSKLLNQ